jgi:transaldolase/glucose-6-phosphate isomerase
MAELAYALGPWQTHVDRRLAAWAAASFGERLWRKDGRLWSETPRPELDDRLGWLDAPFASPDLLAALEGFAAAVRAEGVKTVLLLGMGGSSLAPLVYRRTFGVRPGHPDLIVLDTVHPDAVSAADRDLDWARTLVVVSSKSGTTAETEALMAWAWARAHASGAPGGRFVAITDPGSPLDRRASELDFRRVWHGPVDVGGRYSALTVFGLLPAVLVGVDGRRLLGAARRYAEASRTATHPGDDPGLRLGAFLGELALAGRDKVTFLLSPALASFGLWAEQLLAESTGKDGRGLVPVVGERPGDADRYGPDRVFVDMGLAGEEPHAELVAALVRRGHPVHRVRLHEREELGAEFLRWEVAVAAAGAVLGVNPFDQPDVEGAKSATRRLLNAFAADGRLELAPAVAPDDRAALLDLLAAVPRGGYVAVQAYLPPSAEVEALLGDLQAVLRDRTGLAATAGFGPRYLHSTGQLHKGGPARGGFLQLVDEAAATIPVPGRPYDLATLARAQAEGDRLALAERGRPLVRVELGRDAAAGLGRLLATLTNRSVG